jgi:hypothetical protein
VSSEAPPPNVAASRAKDLATADRYFTDGANLYRYLGEITGGVEQ